MEEPDPLKLERVRRFDRPMISIGYKVASAACVVIMGSCVKAAAHVPLGPAVFFRSVAALIILVAPMYFRGELSERCDTKRPMAHIGPGLIGVAGLFFSFVAFTRLPITEVTTLLYALPLVLVAGGALLFKEQVGPYRCAAAVVGVVGVTIVAWPGLSISAHASDFNLNCGIGLVCALGAVCASASASFAVRRLIATERSSCLVLPFSAVFAVSSLATIPFG